MLISKKLANGFTLIETLVALVIISIGILGFALMQVESLKASKTATERTKAIQFATDMMDRIRSNKVAATTDAAGNITGLNISVYDSEVASPIGAPTVLCADSFNTVIVNPILNPPNCSVTQMAEYELWQWRTMIADPKLGFGTPGKAGVSVTTALPSTLATVAVTIEWSERDQAKSYVLESRLFN